jgi:GNAT superfamily N-acetyltransferase
MTSFRLRPARPEDVEAVTEIVVALESSLYGATVYTQSDLESEWSLLDLEQRSRVLVDGDRIVGYGTLHERGELWRTEGYVHPSVHGRGAGATLAEELEREAAARGARRVQNSILEPDAAAHGLLESLGYRPVRVFRELRIELQEPPPNPAWPEGLHVDAFDPERDARDFHAAHQEAFADHWEHTPREFEDWRKFNIANEKFDASLWCVVRDGDEIAAGAINVGVLYGGGWVAALFTRRRWRGRGVGRALLQDAFVRFWEHGEPSVGLGVDAESATGAFRLYERAGMTPTLGWVTYEKALDDRPA